MRLLGYLLVVIGGVYALLLGFLYFCQARLVFFPVRGLAAVPGRPGPAYEDVELDAGGTRIHGWFVSADAGGAPVVLFCHGNAGNIGDRRDLLEHLHESGLSVLIFDYAGYGRSEGAPSEEETYADAEAAYRWLRARGYADSDIIVYGRSLGGAVAAHVARGRPVRALVLEAAFTSLADMARVHYPWVPARWLLRYRFDTREHVRAARAPVFVIASPEDELVPFPLSRALYEAAPRPRHWVRTSGGHNTLDPVDWARVLEEAEA